MFPLYIWSIVGIITLVARYSTRITNLLGNRAVPVLATLILLSYNKLLRTSIDILDFSILTTYDSETNVTNSATIVWLLDGTLDYFRYPHILLLLAALLTLLCFNDGFPIPSYSMAAKNFSLLVSEVDYKVPTFL